MKVKEMNLNAQAIELALRALNRVSGAAMHEVDIEVVAETGSTNADLMQRVKSGAMSSRPLLLIAESQTAGRGRAGRAWLSAPGGVLTFSLAWHFPAQAQALMGLPLAVGVAVAECLQKIGVPVALKWPNDVLKEGKKLAGILVETQTNSEPGVWAIIGVGLNLRIPEELESEIGHAVADAPWLAQMDRNELMAALLHSLQQVLWTFEQAGFTALAERWNRLHAYHQQEVKIIDQGQLLHQGQALGVDERGSLLLLVAGTVLTIHSGDVSLRPLA